MNESMLFKFLGEGNQQQQQLIGEKSSFSPEYMQKQKKKEANFEGTLDKKINPYVNIDGSKSGGSSRDKDKARDKGRQNQNKVYSHIQTFQAKQEFNRTQKACITVIGSQDQSQRYVKNSGLGLQGLGLLKSSIGQKKQNIVKTGDQKEGFYYGERDLTKESNHQVKSNINYHTLPLKTTK